MSFAGHSKYELIIYLPTRVSVFSRQRRGPQETRDQLPITSVVTKRFENRNEFRFRFPSGCRTVLYCCAGATQRREKKPKPSPRELRSESPRKYPVWSHCNFLRLQSCFGRVDENARHILLNVRYSLFCAQLLLLSLRNSALL